MDTDHDQTHTDAPAELGTYAHVRAIVERNALWIEIAIGVIAWIALMLAYPLQSTTPIYAGF